MERFIMTTILATALLSRVLGEPVSDAEGDRLYREYWRAQKTGICNIHRIRMQNKLVPIRFGYFAFDASYDSAEIQKFPNAQEYILGGCVVDEKRVGKRVPIYICPECKRAQKEWEARHDHKPDSPLVGVHKNT
jgi:hypothetical protein